MTPEERVALYIKAREESDEDKDMPGDSNEFRDYLARTMVEMVREAEADVVRAVFRIVDRLKDANRPAHFDSDSTPSGGYEWACEQIAEEVGEAWPAVVEAMNEEYRAECQSLADRHNALSPETPVEFVAANTTFRMGRHIYHKNEVEKIVAALERQAAGEQPKFVCSPGA